MLIRYKTSSNRLLKCIDNAFTFVNYGHSSHNKAYIRIECYKNTNILQDAQLVGDYSQLLRLIGDYVIRELQNIVSKYKSVYVDGYSEIRFDGSGLIEIIQKYLKDKGIIKGAQLRVDFLLNYKPNLKYDKELDARYGTSMYF